MKITYFTSGGGFMKITFVFKIKCFGFRNTPFLKENSKSFPRLGVERFSHQLSTNATNEPDLWFLCQLNCMYFIAPNRSWRWLVHNYSNFNEPLLDFEPFGRVLESYKSLQENWSRIWNIRLLQLFIPRTTESFGIPRAKKYYTLRIVTYVILI